jgi:hypothetical protein
MSGFAVILDLNCIFVLYLETVLIKIVLIHSKSN